MYCLSFLCHCFINCCLYYSLPSVFIHLFFFLIYPCLLPNFLSCYFLLYFCIYLFLVLWPIHIPFHPVIYFFFVLNFPASYSLCSTLTSFHYIFFLIFHMLIIYPLIFLVFPSVSFFLYTSLKCVLCVVLLRNRSVLMFIRCQFICMSEINTRLKLWFLRLQRLPTVGIELPTQGLFHHRKAHRKAHIPCKIQTLDPRVRQATFKFLFY